MSTLDALQIAQLDDNSKKELMEYINSENSKAKVQTSIHTFTDMCFKKCVTSPISTGQLIGNEETCLNNCLNRFLDVNIKVVEQLQNAQR